MSSVDFPLLAAFDFSGLLSRGTSILLVAVGIGLVIFFHELGHFAVAKWCGVLVERFSIGFGPILWSRKYGETEYALSAIPFGGYVKMLGQDDLDPSQLTSEEIAKDPRSYSAKSVGQRMAIISAGVTMNVLTAVLFYAVAFGHGIEVPPSVAGPLQIGFPAWQAGIRPGDRITSIAGRDTSSFEDIQRGIAFSSGPVEIKGVHPDGTPFQLLLEPRLADGRRMIGVTPSWGLQLPDVEPVASPGSPAAAAKPPFQPGDKIIAIGGQEVNNFNQLQELLAANRDKAVDFRVVNPKDSPAQRTVHVSPQPFRGIGLRMDIGKIVALIKGSRAERSGIQVGDKMLRVNGRSVGKEIDPLRLPDELAALAGKEVTISVLRELKGADPQIKDIRIIPDAKPGWVERPFGAEIPLSAPAIGVAYNVVPTVLEVAPKSPADEAGIKTGDRIKTAKFVLRAGVKSDLFLKDPVVDFADPRASAPADWAYVVELMQVANDRDVVLTLAGPEGRTVRCTPVADARENWYVPGERGLHFDLQMITQKSTNLFEAASMGFWQTRNSIVDLYLTLRNLITGQLSVENLHGPLGIASVAYHFARKGLAEMCLFLGILSANLAVLNFLPIPVLDGGHMLFLIWEGVTRRKPSERVQIAATYFGFAFVLCLAVLVFYLDIFVHHVIL